MRLKIWDLSEEESKRLWFDHEVKSVGVDSDRRLYCEDILGNYIPIILLRDGIDVFEIEE